MLSQVLSETPIDEQALLASLQDECTFVTD